MSRGKGTLKNNQNSKKVKFAEKWMDLGSILDEVIQTQKEKSAHSLSFLFKSRLGYISRLCLKKPKQKMGQRQLLIFHQDRQAGGG